MKKIAIRRPLFLSITAALALTAGCASIVVSNDAIETNTARTLGLEKGSFTISDRQDEGVKSSYLVKTNAGKKYNCYVTGAVSTIGHAVSDAVCTPIGKAGATQSSTPAPNCNALLKSAGKC